MANTSRIVFERLIHVVGSTLPYNFSTYLADQITLGAVGLELRNNGFVQAIGNSVAAGPVSFRMLVRDNHGVSRLAKTDPFRLNFINTSLFRFATEKLAAGVIGFTPKRKSGVSRIRCRRERAADGAG